MILLPLTSLANPTGMFHQTNLFCFLKKKNHYISLLILGVHLCHDVHVEVREQFTQASALLSSRESQGSNLGHKAWWQTPLPAQLSCQTLSNFKVTGSQV